MKVKPKICGGVVLFNPDNDVLTNIDSYIGQVDRLLVVDNSNGIDPNFHKKLRSLRRCEIVRSGGNRGIAIALNELAGRAVALGYDFLLTMDQDSTAHPGMVSSLLDAVKKNGYVLESSGIISPFQKDVSIQDVPDTECDEVLFVITSGNLLNLKAYAETGPFSEELFIDRVDHEYCLRLHIRGYSVIRVNTVLMDHTLGAITVHRLLGRAQSVTNHSPVRRYYLVRNGFHVAAKYAENFPEYAKAEKRMIIFEILKIILFEKSKMGKLWHCILGYIDYRKGRLGKFEDIHN